MQNLFGEFENWDSQNLSIALATVVNTWGSSPRGVGSKMMVNINGEIVGSVSGGCVEGAVAAACVEIIRTGKSRLLHYGVTNESAWDVGLACGGEIEIFVQVLDSRLFSRLMDAWKQGVVGVRMVVISGPDTLLGREMILVGKGDVIHNLPSFSTSSVDSLTRSALSEGTSSRKVLSLADGIEIDVFIDQIVLPPSLIVVGCVHIAIPLVSFAKILGYHTVVIDPRHGFGSRERFAHADRIINEWPQDAFKAVDLTPFTAVAILTHDSKIDDPALEIVLKSPAFYVGALGSRKTQAERKARLLAAGISDDRITKIKGPIGLDLGGMSPEEIALGIMAEIVQTWNQV